MTYFHGEDAGSMPVTTSERMTDLDAVMWSLDQHPRLSNTIVGVGFFSPAFDVDRVRRRVDRASRVVPRLRQKVSAPPGPVPPWWELDPEFDLDHHLRFMGPAEATRSEVMAAATRAAAEPFPEHRPLWQITVFPRVEGDQSALVMKAHHSVTDGLGALRIQAELFDLEAEAPTRDLPDEPGGTPVPLLQILGATVADEVGRAGRMVRGAAHLARAVAAAPGDSCDRGIATLGSIARAGLGSGEPLSPLMVDRAYDMVLNGFSFPFDDAKAAAAHAGVKLNDFFVTAVCLGIADYHERKGYTVERLRMGMPLNVRGPGERDAPGNQIAAVRLEVPIGCGTPAEQMQINHALLRTARSEESVAAMSSLYGLVSRLPRNLIASTFATVLSGTDFLASNVPGVPVPVYMEGSRLLEQFPFGPLSTAAANITLMSYAGALNLGVATDSAAVPDPDELVDSLRAGFTTAARLG